MRIVQLANLVTPTSGGIRTVLDRIGRGYVAAGHDVHRIVPSGRAAVEVTPAGVTHLLPGRRLPRSGGYRMLVDRAPVARLLADLAPDRLEVSDRFTLVWVGRWAAERGIPATVVVHERLVETLRTWLPGGVGARTLSAVADRRLPRAFERVVVPSRFAAAAFPGADNVEVVPLGVDLATFRPGRAAQLPEGVPERDLARPRLVTVTRLSREKRPGLALDTLGALLAAGVDAELVVVGDGPLRRRMVRAAADLPVTFAGFLHDRRALASVLGSADVALATCPIETFGLSALEALACATPVVAARGGALDELVTPDAGEVVDPEPAAMASAVRRLLAADHDELRRAARARAESYPWRAVVGQLLAVHRRTGSARTAPDGARASGAPALSTHVE